MPLVFPACRVGIQESSRSIRLLLGHSLRIVLTQLKILLDNSGIIWYTLIIQ